MLSELEIKIVRVGRQDLYNRSITSFKALVKGMSFQGAHNATHAHTVSAIEALVRALNPGHDGPGGYREFKFYTPIEVGSEQVAGQWGGVNTFTTFEFPFTVSESGCD